MMRLTRLTEVSEPALIDAGGQRHRLSDLVATIELLEFQYLRACARPDPVAARVALAMGRSLAQRYALIYLLDGQCGLLDQRGIDVNPN